MSIADNIRRLEEEIEKACIRSGRDRSLVRLMGVSKFHDRSSVEEAWAAGIRLFGENRVQEAAKKFTGFALSHPGTELHLTGSLQSNKAKAASSLFDCIQSVDRDSLILELAKHCAGRAKPLGILLELHTGEESKIGFPDEDGLYRAAEILVSCPGLLPLGLMTMAPFTEEKKRIRASFRTLVKAREGLRARFPQWDWSTLSMGMSGDFEIAIEEGSTLLRIGTLIFGERDR
ncbi:MAG: YggS family pyridoxal phosphate-dependent enzyme [Treponema sp.]|jgi:pyridoxal phosphate enzyme (YggS family)|nr:YggS family pyridoxal phosphate-dependent enzyme [Treponema sp.]